MMALSLLAAALVGFVAAAIALRWGKMGFWQSMILGWLAGMIVDAAAWRWVL